MNVLYFLSMFILLLRTSGGMENLITIWDFAGQKQFYVTHQCFLSQRGVYLVVFSLKVRILNISSSVFTYIYLSTAACL